MLTKEIIDLYDEFTHHPLTRSEFISRLVKIVGSLSIANATMQLLESEYRPFTIPSDLVTEDTYYEGKTGKVFTFVCRPKPEQAYPGVLLIHENRGLTPYIKEVACRLAQAGFIAIAPDALSPLGGYTGDEDESRQLFQQLKQEESQQNFLAALNYLSSRTDCNGFLGCIGFCWGGAMAGYLAHTSNQLKASIAYYGRQPALDQVHLIACPVQLHYAGLDSRINEGINQYIGALDSFQKKYELFIYDNVNHAFHNHFSKARYNENAANLSWERSITFLKKHLK
jgi:carboxymethylenebutenolidase